MLAELAKDGTVAERDDMPCISLAFVIWHSEEIEDGCWIAAWIDRSRSAIIRKASSMHQIVRHLTLLSTALHLFAISPSYGQAQTPLAQLKPVTGGFTVYDGERHEFSMSGQVFSGIIRFSSQHLVYSLGRKYTQFTAVVGVCDKRFPYTSQNHDFRYTISVDGNVVADNQDNLLQPGDAPVPVSVDLTGARSLDISCSPGVGWGDPILINAAVDGQAAGGVAVPISPLDGSRVSGQYVSLSWSQVPGATSYGIEIVCTKGSKPAIYSYNSDAATFTFQVPDGGDGDYVWSIIAFGPNGSLGKFSKGRRFHSTAHLQVGARMEAVAIRRHITQF